MDLLKRQDALEAENADLQKLASRGAEVAELNRQIASYELANGHDDWIFAQ